MKIIFELEPDEDGYPPVGSEGVWANPIGDELYEIDNIPFFTCDATLGDVVKVFDHGEMLCYEGTVRESGNSLVRVVCFDGTDPQPIRDRLRRIGCRSELDGIHGLSAINIPPDVSLASVRAVLEPDITTDRIDYEEAILRQ